MPARRLKSRYVGLKAKNRMASKLGIYLRFLAVSGSDILPSACPIS